MPLSNDGLTLRQIRPPKHLGSKKLIYFIFGLDKIFFKTSIFYRVPKNNSPPPQSKLNMTEKK